jgi:DnaJ-class molecular chaperone
MTKFVTCPACSGSGAIRGGCSGIMAHLASLPSPMKSEFACHQCDGTGVIEVNDSNDSDLQPSSSNKVES